MNFILKFFNFITPTAPFMNFLFSTIFATNLSSDELDKFKDSIVTKQSLRFYAEVFFDSWRDRFDVEALKKVFNLTLHLHTASKIFIDENQSKIAHNDLIKRLVDSHRKTLKKASKLYIYFKYKLLNLFQNVFNEHAIDKNIIVFYDSFKVSNDDFKQFAKDEIEKAFKNEVRLNDYMREIVGYTESTAFDNLNEEYNKTDNKILNEQAFNQVVTVFRDSKERETDAVRLYRFFNKPQEMRYKDRVPPLNAETERFSVKLIDEIKKSAVPPPSPPDQQTNMPIIYSIITGIILILISSLIAYVYYRKNIKKHMTETEINNNIAVLIK